MVFETHAMTVAQDAIAVWAALLFLGWTWQATDILPTLRVIVVAMRVTQTATRGIGRAVLIIAPVQKRLGIEVFVSPVVIKDGCGFSATTLPSLASPRRQPRFVIRTVLQRGVAGALVPGAPLRIWPDDCVATPGFRGSPSTHRNRH